MLRLTSALTLQALLANDVTTNALNAVVNFSDKAPDSYGDPATCAPKFTALDLSAGAFDICAAPAAGVLRAIDSISIFNADTVAATVTVRYSAASSDILHATLEAGECLGFTHSNGWYVNTADGSRKSGAVQDLSGLQPLDSDLTVIAALAPPDDDILQRKAGAWTARSPAQIKTDLVLVKGDVGLDQVDNTSDANKPVSAAQATADATALASAKTYADGLVVGLWDDRGTFDASANAFPATGGSGTAGAILKGDIWTISVAGTLGGHDVNIGDNVRALVDSPGSTDSHWAIGEANIGYVPENAANKVTAFSTPTDVQYPSAKLVSDQLALKEASANKDATGGYAGLTLFKINFKNALNTFTSFFTNSNTAARTYTFQDKDGTVAMTSDITGTNSGTNTGDETATSVATILHAATGKTTPVDADELALVDSAASNVLKKLTWANLKATLKTYLDTLYQATLVSGTNIKTVNSTSLLGSGDLAISASPGGSSGAVQGNTSSAFAAIPGFTYDTTSGALTVATGTITTSQPAQTITQTWNASGVTFTGWKMNITSTASAAGSLLVDLQVASASKFSVDKTGRATDALGYYAVGGTSAAPSFSVGNGGTGFYGDNSSIKFAFQGTDLIQFYGGSGQDGIYLKSDQSLAWSSGALGASSDIFLQRVSAGLLKLTSDASTTFADLKLRNLLGTGAIASATVAKTADYTVTLNDRQIEADSTSGVLTLTLPALSTCTAGQEFIAVKTDSSGNAVVFDGNASETINGATTLSTSTQYGILRIKVNAAKSGFYTF